MKLTVHGLDEDLTKLAIEFYCSELDIQPRELSIMVDDIMEQNGKCFENEYGDYLILVKVDGRNITQIFLTLAHEMIHVKQYLKDRLSACLFDFKKDLSYKETWWEQEAFGGETELLTNFVKTI